MIPPSGPSPGQRSAMHSTPICPYLSASPMTRTGAATASCRSRESRAINGSPSNSASALSLPKRRLAPPASTNPATCAALLFPITNHQSQVTLPTVAKLLRIFHRLAPRPPDTEFAQLFLQALTVKSDRRRRARYIPPVARKLLRQICDFELVLCFAKIIFAKP